MRLPLPALLCCSAASLLLLLLRWRRRSGLWRKVRAARQRQERSLVRMEMAVQRFREQHPSVNVVSILKLPLPELTKKLRDGSLPLEHVFYAYVGKALSHLWALPAFPKALQMATETNCITEYLQESETQVQKMKPVGKLGLLYGVPVSLKDSIDCQGHDSTLGFIRNINKPVAEDSVVVQVLRRQGAIPFVKTNVPQSLVSKKGVVSGIPGQKAVTAAVGPMAKDVESLALSMRALLCEDMFSLDSSVPPIPFNEEVYSSTQPLRIGYYETDFFTMPSPAMRRAIRETKQLLEDAGHTLVPFELMNVDYAFFNFCVKGVFADGGASFLRKFKGELEESSLGMLWLMKSPNWLKNVLSWITKPFMPRFSAVLASMRANTVDQVWSLHCEIEEFSQQFTAQWKKLNLDVMLCPMLGPALGIGYPPKLSVAVSYTMLYNALDFPAGVVPVTMVTDEDEEELKDYQGYFRDWWDRTMAKAFRGSVGLPVSVQCVALPWQEELCLRFMKEVETLALKNNSFI
ncbi:fatty-acid amide hydrolase 1 isoform X3 [Melopsittacus undulatus]|uniref:fatty-acid amide hydrolase 1 isoform X3 n=1 Tax=Melopsittacus undulatus TaxID=13146 RepID=UPI00146B2E70|nr:fatty-acid amide hydrolase 1 isoform X3 [Melopsittacus undulatus]